MTTTAPITSSHLTVATRALLDHIEAHHLPFPKGIHAPHEFGHLNPSSLLVDIDKSAYDAWLDSGLIVDTQDDDHRTGLTGHPYVRTVIEGRLPDMGVRVSVYVLRPAPRLQAVNR